eukprot:1951126-Amphidinium_carterae.1
MCRIASLNVRSLDAKQVGIAHSSGLNQTGRSQLLRTELDGCDVVCLQETRMATQFAPPCESFHVASADPVNGWGGLQILVHKNRGLELRWTKQIGDRIL